VSAKVRIRTPSDRQVERRDTSCGVSLPASPNARNRGKRACRVSPFSLDPCAHRLSELQRQIRQLWVAQRAVQLAVSDAELDAGSKVRHRLRLVFGRL
jgi:hypothetical protein